MSEKNVNHIKWMKRAIHLASLGDGKTSPNPKVGAVILDKNGNISGPIKLVYPQKASGNFLIAKRSAIKAVLESSPFPVPKESFPRGLVLRVVFDPKTNVGVNNG